MKTRLSHLDPSILRQGCSSTRGIRGIAVLFAILALTLPTAHAWATQPTLPSGVPNVLDPEVLAHYRVLAVANLRGNPDFPALLLMNTTEEQPGAVLLALDARNGAETWSLGSDPIILIVVFSGPSNIQGMYVDSGFADQGKASGNFAAVDIGNPPAVPDLLKAVTQAPSLRPI